MPGRARLADAVRLGAVRAGWARHACRPGVVRVLPRRACRALRRALRRGHRVVGAHSALACALLWGRLAQPARHARRVAPARAQERVRGQRAGSDRRQLSVRAEPRLTRVVVAPGTLRVAREVVVRRRRVDQARGVVARRVHGVDDARLRALVVLQRHDVPHVVAACRVRRDVAPERRRVHLRHGALHAHGRAAARRHGRLQHVGGAHAPRHLIAGPHAPLPLVRLREHGGRLGGGVVRHGRARREVVHDRLRGALAVLGAAQPHVPLRWPQDPPRVRPDVGRELGVAHAHGERGRLGEPLAPPHSPKQRHAAAVVHRTEHQVGVVPALLHVSHGRVRHGVPVAPSDYHAAR
mmetsp:Transcript_10238/g.35625  ORF Transcript_10238/g.35625 Transcript_10238/m.35625 type:complete len:352 (+) Transcript_10238:1842-2897(+)